MSFFMDIFRHATTSTGNGVLDSDAIVDIFPAVIVVSLVVAAIVALCRRGHRLRSDVESHAESISHDHVPTSSTPLLRDVSPAILQTVEFEDPVLTLHRHLGHLSIPSVQKLLFVSGRIGFTEEYIRKRLQAICHVCARIQAQHRPYTPPESCEPDMRTWPVGASYDISLIDDGYDGLVLDSYEDVSNILAGIPEFACWDNTLPEPAPSALLEDTVDPWNLEYQPNPVIFSRFEYGMNSERSEEAFQQESHALDDYTGLQLNLYQSMEESQGNMTHVSAMPEHEMHVDLVEDGSKDAVQLEYGPCSQSTAMAESSVEVSANLGVGHPDVQLPFSEECFNATLQGSSNPHQLRTPSATTNVDLPFVCNECKQSFRTPGQLREHGRRKHIRRFVCSICSRDFNLRADLTRHERTVHGNDIIVSASMRGSGSQKCPNLKCKSADKVWARRDNFVRHVKRCRKAGERLAT